MIKNVDFGNQKWSWTDQSVTNNNSLLLVSTLLITFASGFGQNKVQQNISLICHNLNLNQLFFDALLGLWRKMNYKRIANKTISHR